MRLAVGTTALDLRAWGITELSPSTPVAVAEQRTTKSYVTVPLGVGAHRVEIGGQFRASSPARAQWAMLEAWAAARETISVAEYVGHDDEHTVWGDYHLDGALRLTGSELLNGRPVAYQWRLRLVAATPQAG